MKIEIEISMVQLAGLEAVMDLIKETGDKIMATLDDIKAQIAQANESTNDIASDIRALKTQLDQAISSAQGQVDAQVQEQLQQVSDALQPLVTRLEDVAGQTE